MQNGDRNERVFFRLASLYRRNNFYNNLFNYWQWYSNSLKYKMSFEITRNQKPAGASVSGIELLFTLQSVTFIQGP
jgi:hypothetical protein